MTARGPATPKHAPQPVHDPEYELLGPWWTYDAPTLRVADRRRVYVSIWSAGDAGPSVLLVPPAAADHRIWEPLLPRLTEHLIVHALDPRSQKAEFDPDVEGVCTALAAVGAQLARPMAEMNFFFREHNGGLFAAHAYPHDHGLGTWIVETDEQTFLDAGLDSADERTTVALMEARRSRPARPWPTAWRHMTPGAAPRSRYCSGARLARCTGSRRCARTGRCRRRSSP
jgi:hypothetical protein